MIRFPQLSIATSVVNRILNIHADIQAQQKSLALGSAEGGDPEVPSTTVTGEALDQQLYAPTQPSDAEQPIADAVTLKGLL